MRGAVTAVTILAGLLVILTAASCSTTPAISSEPPQASSPVLSPSSSSIPGQDIPAPAVPTAAPGRPTPTAAPAPLPSPRSHGYKTVGYITHWQVDLLPRIRLDELTHLIWQGVQVTGPDDPTLRVNDNYPWEQIPFLAKAARPRGIKVLASLGEAWGGSALNTIWRSDSLRAELVANLTDLVLKNELDGIDIDNETNPDPRLYAKFLGELYASLSPSGKIISIAGGPKTLPVTPEAVKYLDFVSIMAYDMGYPYHSTYNESIQAAKLWLQAKIPGEKLLLGIPFYGRDSSHTFYFYSHIVDKYLPSPDQDEIAEPKAAGGKIWWNGMNLVKKKVDFVKGAGLGGVMVYEVTIDSTREDYSLLRAITDELVKPPSTGPQP